MHLHTVYMEYAECLPNSFGPLAERNSFSQVRWRRCSTPDASGAWGRARDDGHCNHTGHHDSVIHVRHRAMRWNQRFRSQLTHALFPIVSNLPPVKLPRARCLGPSPKVRVQCMATLIAPLASRRAKYRRYGSKRCGFIASRDVQP
jgi:hypothetical protein